jgi:hypothetical protein
VQPSAEEPPPPALHPCDPASTDYRDARQRLDRIDAEIQALAPDGDPASIVRELNALGSSPCFAIGGGLELPEQKGPHDGGPDSAYALKAFWRDGGKDWIEGYLDLAVPAGKGGQRYLWTEPDFPVTLSRETNGNTALAPMLCSVSDEACSKETESFRTRFDGRFELFDAGRRLADQRKFEHDSDFLDLGLCLSQPAASTQLAAWVRCLRDHRDRRLAIPLPGVRRPTSGWLFLEESGSGIAVSERMCDSERAYDLATGAAFEVRSCLRGILNASGAYDQDATERTRWTESARGSVPPSALSEAVWFLLQVDSLYDRAISRGSAVPAGLELSYTPTKALLRGGRVSHFCSCSDCGGPSWTYVIEGATIAQGVTKWTPHCWDPHAEVQSYAAELLVIAEQQFTAGCPSREPPRTRPLRQLVERGRDHPTERERSIDAAWQRLRDSRCKRRP